MLIGALLIGLLTGYYFGIKPGIVAAAATALLFVVAEIIPGASLLVYAAVAAFIIGVIFVGPYRLKKQEQDGANRVRRMARQTLGKLWRWL